VNKVDELLDGIFSSDRPPPRRPSGLVRSVKDVAQDYVDFALNPQNRFRTGYQWLDAAMKGGTAPGEVTTFAAGANTGKTTVMCNLGANNTETPMIFFTIEMPEILVVARLYAITFDEEFRSLEERLKGGDRPLEGRMRGELGERLPMFGLVGVGAPDLATMKDAIQDYEQAFQAHPKIAMIDYLDLMAPNSENVEAVKSKYVGLREFGKALDLGVIVAHQIKREVLEGRHGSPLRFTDTRYAGESESDHLIGWYRRVNDPKVMRNALLHAEHRWTIHVQVLKTRSGEPQAVIEGHEMGWNPETLRVTDTPDLEELVPEVVTEELPADKARDFFADQLKEAT